MAAVVAVAASSIAAPPCRGESGRLEPVIVYPTGTEMVFGDITVLVDVRGDVPVERVLLSIDGLPLATRSAAPYAFPVALGDGNDSHRFEVEVVGVDGSRARAFVETPAIQVDDVVDLSLRQIYVTVSDRRGQRLLDLGKESFRILDDGRLQRIVTFASGDIPFSAILLLDGSESMMGRQIRAARTGARAFLAGMNELDEAKVVVFSTRLLAASDFAGKYEPFSRLVEEVEPDGGTAINDFLFLALRRLESRHGRRVIILLSDGWDVHSILDARQVQGIARQSQAQIYWLRLDDDSPAAANLVNSWREPPRNREEFRLLEKTIAESGGRVIAVAAPDDVPAAFEQVLDELRAQYALGYYPDRTFGDGRWRRLEVAVDGGSNVKHREGYLDLP